ncbi:MAG: chitobiase/beta-hexosaminidase C-terminal domain-containing protein [Patescibacteria group bacterium]
MTRITLKTSILLSLFISINITYASEVTGTLTTGISASVGTAMNGVVISIPIANPSTGVYISAQSVTLSAEGSSNIHYTTDGATPTCTTGNIYSSPILVNSSLVIEAISCYPSNRTSTVVSYLYGINIPTSSSFLSSSSGGSGESSSSGSGGGSGNTIQIIGKVDTSNDGKVNILDFVTLMANWNRTGSNNIADFNSDGKVDILDFVLLMANWTK